MQRKKVTITDEEIMQYDNVPVEIAAAYIGMGAGSLRYSMQDRDCPVRVRLCESFRHGVLRGAIYLQHQPRTADCVQARDAAMHADERL